MINTGKFIFIHLPKTGGTFVTDVVEMISQKKSFFKKPLLNYERIWQEAGKPNSDDIYGPHGTCDQIPEKFKSLPIVSVFRHPHDRYVSLYEFGWWKKRPEINQDILKENIPNYPDISFREYLEMKNGIVIHTSTEGKLQCDHAGFLTLQFIRYFCYNPEKVIENLSSDATQNLKLIKENMYPVLFLKTDNLNDSLFNYLSDIGLQKDKIQFIHSLDKIFPNGGGRGNSKKWEKYYDDELLNYVRYKEQLLFKLFPEYQL